jgi:flavin-dependent dehydrogenase
VTGSRLDSRDVLIGGAGIAAGAAALRLSSMGFRPLLLATGGRITPGAEAIPETALALFAELEIQDLLVQAGGVVIEGFDNHWNPEEPVLRSGRWIHVERASLAKVILQEAVKRGACVRICKSLPKLSVNSESASIVLESARLHFQAAVDATGRSAVWSRPIQRVGNQVADIFSVAAAPYLRSRVLRRSGKWAYRIGLKNHATVALVAEEGTRRNHPDATTREALGIHGRLQFVGRRAAFPQWSESPVEFRRLAVGDAALAYDPIAGQGICFALSSVLAATAVIKTWQASPAANASAERFYRDFVAQRRQRHLAFLDHMHAGHLPPERAAEPLPEEIVFSGRTARTDLQIDSQIAEAEAVVLPDGSAVRWVGDVDLLRLRELVARPVRSSRVIESLVSARRPPSQVIALLHWCIQQKLVRAAVRD